MKQKLAFGFGSQMWNRSGSMNKDELLFFQSFED